MLILADLKSSRASRISGLCVRSDDWLDLANDAIRELMKRGSFWGSVRIMTGCVYDQRVVWPRQVGTVLAIDRCGRSVPPKNYWYNFDSVLPEYVNYFNRFGVHWPGEYVAADQNTTPVLSQPPCGNDRYVQFYPTDARDADGPNIIGKTITIFGVDSNGQTIRSTYPDGTVQDGLQLRLKLPYIQSPGLIRRITRVIKQPTVMPVAGYWFDGSNRYTLAFYDPTETNPDYRQSQLMGCNTSCCCPSQISALVKLQWIRVSNDNDQIFIENVDAISLAMQSIKLSDAYDGNAEAMMSRAVHDMNVELKEKLPIDQTVVRVHYQGTADLRKQRIGSLM